jgi:transposase-like protein
VYQGLTLDPKVTLIWELLQLGMKHTHALLEEEVTRLAGARYARKAGSALGTRYGSNAGSVRLAGQGVALRVPRMRAAYGAPALKLCGVAGLRWAP